MEDKGPEQDEAFFSGRLSRAVWRRQRGSCIHLGTDRSFPRCDGPVKLINHLLFEYLQPFNLGLIGLFVPFGLLLEYILISKHELHVLEEKRGGSSETTIRYLSMDLLVHLEDVERHIF